MNPSQYARARNQAEDLEYKLKDLLDDKNNSSAQALLSGAKAILEDFESQKNPRSIEDKVRRIIDQLESLSRQKQEVIDYRHADLIQNGYARMRQDLRNFDNY